MNPTRSKSPHPTERLRGSAVAPRRSPSRASLPPGRRPTSARHVQCGLRRHTVRPGVPPIPPVLTTLPELASRISASSGTCAMSPRGAASLSRLQLRPSRQGRSSCGRAGAPRHVTSRHAGLTRVAIRAAFLRQMSKSARDRTCRGSHASSIQWQPDLRRVTPPRSYPRKGIAL